MVPAGPPTHAGCSMGKGGGQICGPRSRPGWQWPPPRGRAAGRNTSAVTVLPSLARMFHVDA
eukprot:1291974-Alexandrium_andersonii.AAC.1